MNNLADINHMLTNIATLTVFKNFLSDDVGIKFIVFLEAVKERDEISRVFEFYSDFISELYNSENIGDWSSYVRNFVLTDENVVSIQCSKNKNPKIPNFIMGAFEYELRILSDIASITYDDVREMLVNNYPQNRDVIFINSLPSFDSYKLLFTKEQIQNSYKTDGYGTVKKYGAFKFNENCELEPVLSRDDITLNDLKLYDYQKDIVKNNTLSFLKGNKANNILLYGDRGCGKSSLVKAIANEYQNLGLKIIQINKENFCEIEKLYQYLSNFPSKFIVFADDLVFDENDPMFSLSKAMLEGTVSKHPDNVLMYATSNRRHLIKESFSSRAGDEIHLNDTMDEAASLADRFGITITFSSPDKNKYLEIVRMLADEMNLKYEEEKLFKEAEAFALLKGNRAPRVARQFLMDYLANNQT